MASGKKSKNRVSVWNWLLTLLLMAIPGVNLIAVICFLIFARRQPKRSFALAMLIWMILIAVGTVVVLMVFPEQVSQFADTLRAELDALPTVAPSLAPTVTPGI